MKKLVNAYEHFVAWASMLKSPILLICRLYWGWLFFEAGLNKFQDIGAFAESLNQYHVPFAHVSAYAAAITELVGGLLLIVGFATRLAAIPLAFVMLTAYSTVHADALKSIFSTPSEFVAQAPFNFLLISLILLAFGPGRFSLDYLLERWVFRTA